MDICRLDAWYSTKEGSLDFPATYIVRGLCRRCCLPELILRCMQVTDFSYSFVLIELFELVNIFLVFHVNRYSASRFLVPRSLFHL